MATTRVFDLREMKDWSRILLADFNAKISAWFMNLSNISIDVKMCVSAFDEKSFFKMLGL